MRAVLTLLVAVVLIGGQGHAQRRPNILVDAAGDASGNGGIWWSPQYPDFVPSKPHQGKALADYWRRKGADVEELPGTLTALPWSGGHATDTTAERLSGRDIVVLVRGRLSTLPRIRRLPHIGNTSPAEASSCCYPTL
jgi:hypothetical protein